MELTMRLTTVLIGVAWISGAVMAHHFWHWDGFGCFLLGCVGYAFLKAAVEGPICIVSKRKRLP
jgi:hypothetical protein